MDYPMIQLCRALLQAEARQAEERAKIATATIERAAGYTIIRRECGRPEGELMQLVRWYPTTLMRGLYRIDKPTDIKWAAATAAREVADTVYESLLKFATKI